MSTKVVLRSEVARARLVALGLTQSALAAVCALDIRTVQRWFAGQPVRLAEAERVAGVLGLGTADLFAGVPEHGRGGALELFAMMWRLPLFRDHPSAQVIRNVPRHFAEFLTPLTFRSHPLRGHVASFALAAREQHGFIGYRVHTAAEDVAIQLSIRLATAVLLERAEVRVRARGVWLVETHMPRSMLASRRDDGSFDLWYWVGLEASELLLVSPDALRIEPVAIPEGRRTLFDMGLVEAEHAVCVRPTMTQLAAAGLPRGFDRVLQRNVNRVEIPEPRAYAPPAQARTTPG